MAKVFISYSPEDKLYLDELEMHFSVLSKQGYITSWSKKQIVAGEESLTKTTEELDNADIILLLVSAGFLASDSCYEEMTRAMERHTRKEVILIPVIIRSCNWTDAPFSKIQVLPANERPVNNWPDKDEAYLNIIEGIKNLLKKQNPATRQSSVTKSLTKPASPTFKDTYQFYGDKSIAKFLSSPFIPETFLGREEDLNNIHEQLFKGLNSLLLVNGEGGIGKTTLAAQYFLQYKDEYHHLAWIYTENNLADGLLALAAPMQVSFAETDTAEQRLKKLVAGMHNLHTPCLLIIDNANSHEELEKYYQLLRSCSNFHLLFTSRITEFEQAKTFKIKGLPEAEALILFKKHYPKHQDSENEIFKQIRSAVGGNTLVLELLAKNLFLQNRLKTNYTLEHLLKDLQQRGLLALSQSKGVTTGYQSKNALRKESPENIIAAMYDLSALAVAEKNLLSVFAVLPAENIEYNVLEELLKGMDEFEDNLLSLAKKGWLDFNEAANAFKVSPVVQEITKNKNTDLLKDCDILISNFIDLLDYEPGAGYLVNTNHQQAAKYARYVEISISNFKQLDYNLSVLYERLGNFESTTGNLLKAISFFEKYYWLSNELHKSSRQNEEYIHMLAIACLKLGRIQALLGNLQKALGYFEQETKLFKQLCAEYPQKVEYKNGLGVSYSKLGEIYVSQGNLQKALEYYGLDTQLSEELYAGDLQKTEYKNGLAISYAKLGNTQASLGNFQKALEYYEQEIKLFKQLYAEYPENISFIKGLAISYENLGDIQNISGDVKKALEYYEERTKLSKELYRKHSENVDFKNGLAISYSKLGDTHAKLGNSQKAFEYYELDAQLSKELYTDNTQNVFFKNGLAISYIKLGSANEQDPDKSISKGYYQSAKELLLELVTDSPDYVEFKKNLDWVNERLEEE